MKSILVRKLHRWFGIVFCLSALVSSGSGVIHNVMSRTQTPPPPARPAGAVELSRVKIAPSAVLARLPAVNQVAIQALNVRSIDGNPWYQVLIKDQEKPIYVSGVTGVVDANQDEAYAAQIASGFLSGLPVRKTDYLTRFNREYLNIYRILPVYRFDADDGKGTRLYVSSLTGSVTRHTDDQRQLQSNIFSNFHKLAFIENRTARDAVLTAMTLGIFIASCLGLVLFVFTWR